MASTFGNILLELRIEPIFDSIVSSAGQRLGNLAPSVSVLLMHGKNQAVFFLRPLLLPDVGI